MLKSNNIVAGGKSQSVLYTFEINYIGFAQ